MLGKVEKLSQPYDQKIVCAFALFFFAVAVGEAVNVHDIKTKRTSKRTKYNMNPPNKESLLVGLSLRFDVRDRPRPSNGNADTT